MISPSLSLSRSLARFYIFSTLIVLLTWSETVRPSRREPEKEFDFDYKRTR